MPFREKVRKALGRRTSSSSSNDSDFPKPKFRGPVDPAHKALMESFSFSEATSGTGASSSSTSTSAGRPSWVRRNSGMSQYSPFGSRLPTRNNSLDGSSSGLHIDARRKYAPGKNGVDQLVEDASEENGVHNVGGTRHPSISEPPSSVPSDLSIESNSTIDDDNTLAGRSLPMPFTEADFNNALKKSMSKLSVD